MGNTFNLDPASGSILTGASFIERYLDEVDDNLADPHSQKRLPISKRLRDLFTIQNMHFESLLNLTGQESSIGYFEDTVVVESGRSFYPLPPRYRQFLAFERRVGGDRENIDFTMDSVHGYMGRAGIEILHRERGFRILPTPGTLEAGNWTLVYRQGPPKLFYGVVNSINEDGDSVVVDVPASADAGEMVALSNYYAGAILNIYAGFTGVPQARVIASSVYDGDAEQTTFNLRDALDPIPADSEAGGALLAEIMPDVPMGLDSIYAMDCAIINAGRRTRIALRSGLRQDRGLLWASVANFYTNNVADRAPGRVVPARADEVDPYD